MEIATESFVDPLARALWDARERGVAVNSAEDWVDLSSDRAEAISAALYQRLISTAPSAWKMGAFDEESQLRLGLDGPLVAPVMPDRLHLGVTEVSLQIRDFVQPKLEAEVGVRIDGTGHTLVPCVEVADTRFADWVVPRFGAVADFGLQGAMVFGLDGAAFDEIEVTVRHDGVKVGSGSATWTSVLERLSLIPGAGEGTAHVATGSMTPMFPATPGIWEFDFKGLEPLILELT